MKLYNIKTNPPTVIVEFDRRNRVVFMHPLLKRLIDVQKGVVLPAIKKLTDQFDGLCKIPREHPKFSTAFKVYLEIEFLTHPDCYSWGNGENTTPIVKRVQEANNQN